MFPKLLEQLGFFLMEFVLLAYLAATTTSSSSSSAPLTSTPAHCRGLPDDGILRCERDAQLGACANLTTHCLVSPSLRKPEQQRDQLLGAPTSSAAWSHRRASTLRRGVAASAPWPQAWARCTSCSYAAGMVTLYDPDGALAAVETVAVQPPLRLASSKWHGFFYHEGLTDEVHARVVATPLRTARSRCTRFVEERTMCVFFFFQ